MDWSVGCRQTRERAIAESRKTPWSFGEAHCLDVAGSPLVMPTGVSVSTRWIVNRSLYVYEELTFPGILFEMICIIAVNVHRCPWFLYCLMILSDIWSMR